MSKEKQIEEMAKIISDGFVECESMLNECGKCRYNNVDIGHCSECFGAEKLFDAGYRKASKVIEDIFKRLYEHIKFDGHTVAVWKNDLLCIAKEYGVNLE